MRAAVLAIAVACGCGRIGIDPVPQPDAAPLGWLGSFASRDKAGGAGFTGDSFPAQARRQGDAVLLFAGCTSPSATAVTMSAPGWTFQPLTQLIGSSSMAVWGEVFAAIAPDTAATTVDVTWTGSPCADIIEIGDELGGDDPAGGTATFDTEAGQPGTDCMLTIATGHDDDAIWAACYGANSVTAAGSGFQKGTDDGHGDWSEYAITSDPAHTVETVSFVKPAGSSVVIAVAIAPAR